MNQINNRVNKLDTRISRVGAGAAALASLHPLEFSPEAKWDISAGIGNYRGASAVAIGAFYRPDNRTLLSLGGSTGGENMWNFGVSVKLGCTSQYEGVSKAQLIAENEELKCNDTLLDQKIQEFMKIVAELQQKMK